MRYLCELHTCIHCHSSGYSVCARIYVHTEEHSIHTCISVPIGECVLEEMSLWCLYPMYVRTLQCAQPSCKICCCCCCLQIPVMNLLLSFHRALIRMLPSLLLDRLSRTLLRTGPTTGITLFVEKTALGGSQTGRCCPRQTDHPSLFLN